MIFHVFSKCSWLLEGSVDCCYFILKKYKHFRYFLWYFGRRQAFHTCSLNLVLLLLMDHYTRTRERTLTGEDYSTIFSETLFLSLGNWKLFDEKQADLFFQVRRRAQNSAKGRARKTRERKKKKTYISRRKKVQIGVEKDKWHITGSCVTGVQRSWKTHPVNGMQEKRSGGAHGKLEVRM